MFTSPRSFFHNIRLFISKIFLPCPPHKKSATLESFLPRAIILWNDLPTNVQSSKTLSTFKTKLRLRLHVSRYPDIWISGCQRSGYLGSVYTCRIETFLAFTRLQLSRCFIRGILAMCRRNTQMLFFWSSCMLSNSLPFFLSFFDVCWLDDKVKIVW